MTPDARLAPIFKDLVVAINQLVEKHQITPEEYHAAVGVLSEAGDAGEIPLLFDVFLEALVVDVNSRGYRGTPVNVLGPYYLEGAPFIERGQLVSEDERGDRLVVSGIVRDVEGEVYLADSEYLDSDAANAVRDDLIRPLRQTGSGYSLDFDVLLEPEPTPAG
jgi:catechol 1,2-dioxygenase